MTVKTKKRPDHRAGVAAVFLLVLGWLVLVPPSPAMAAEPKWTPAASMGEARANHTMTVLSGPRCGGDAPAGYCGKVLVAGGRNFQVTNPALLYDPKTGVWAPTGRLNEPRYGHTAISLPDGKVLVLGGIADTPIGISSNQSLASAETYDPETGIWTSTPPMSTARTGPAVTLLSGERCRPRCGVLVTGGDATRLSAELFDPVLRVWTPVGALTTPRSEHSATQLPNGKVLLVGSSFNPPPGICSGTAGSCPGRTAELFDPSTSTFTPTAKPPNPRWGHGAALLPDGGVLVAGGNTFGTPAREGKVDVYQPNGTWTELTEKLVPGAAKPGPLLRLPGGRFLAAGGETSGTPQVYDAATRSWAPTDAMNQSRYGAPLVLLDCTAASGRVLITGGITQTPDTDSVLDAPELYNRVPTLQGVARIAGPAVGGRVPVRLRGLAFDSGQTVKVSFGGVDVPDVDVVVKASGKQIDVMAPTTPGPVPVTVTVDGVPADTCGKDIRFTATACPSTGEVALGPSIQAQNAGPAGTTSAGVGGFGLVDAGLAVSAWATAANQRRRGRRASGPRAGPMWPPGRRRAGQGGFTLVELLVVVVILGILSAVVVFAVRGAGDKGQKAAVQTDERVVRTALEVYCAQNGRYPIDPPDAQGTPGRPDAMDTLVNEKYLGTRSEYTTLATGTGLPEGNCPGTPNSFELTTIPVPGVDPSCP